MSDIIRFSLVQSNPVWQDSETNLLLMDKWMDAMDGQTDIVILPEMFLTGFSMNVQEIAQEMNGPGVKWLSSVAKSRGITMMGSMAIKENDNFYNRLLVADPQGRIAWYDKRHLFRMGEEQLHYTQGVQKLIFSWKEWKIMPMVCYDLRFPVWNRNVNLAYDILVFVANWPESRRDAFLTLLKARAIENQCYVVAVNRVGTDGNGIRYSGDSVIFDPKGIAMNEINSDERLITGQVSLSGLKKFREKFPVHLDADQFLIS